MRQHPLPCNVVEYYSYGFKNQQGMDDSTASLVDWSAADDDQSSLREDTVPRLDDQLSWILSGVGGALQTSWSQPCYHVTFQLVSVCKLEVEWFDDCHYNYDRTSDEGRLNQDLLKISALLRKLDQNLLIRLDPSAHGSRDRLQQSSKFTKLKTYYSIKPVQKSWKMEPLELQIEIMKTQDEFRWIDDELVAIAQTAVGGCHLGFKLIKRRRSAFKRQRLLFRMKITTIECVDAREGCPWRFTLSQGWP